jgi:hypothetical protein
LTIVYDDPQPATGLYVLAVEPLAVRNWVQGPVVGASNGAQDDVDVVEQPWTPLPQMQSGANVEHYLPPVGVTRPWMLERHSEGRYGELRMAPPTLNLA